MPTSKKKVQILSYNPTTSALHNSCLLDGLSIGYFKSYNNYKTSEICAVFDLILLVRGIGG